MAFYHRRGTVTITDTKQRSLWPGLRYVDKWRKGDSHQGEARNPAELMLWDFSTSLGHPFREAWPAWPCYEQSRPSIGSGLWWLILMARLTTSRINRASLSLPSACLKGMNHNSRSDYNSQYHYSYIRLDNFYKLSNLWPIEFSWDRLWNIISLRAVRNFLIWIFSQKRSVKAKRTRKKKAFAFWLLPWLPLASSSTQLLRRSFTFIRTCFWRIPRSAALRESSRMLAPGSAETSNLAIMERPDAWSFHGETATVHQPYIWYKYIS